MADTLTKSVAARVPMDTYVEIIKKASDLKMTVSDYLIMKLFGDTGHTHNDSSRDEIVIGLKKQVKHLEDRHKALELKAREISGQVKPALETGKNDTGLQEKVKAQADQIKVQDSELKSLRKLDEQMKGQQTELRSLRTKLQHRDQRYNELIRDKNTLKAQLDKANSEIKHFGFQLKESREEVDMAHELINSLTEINEQVYQELEGFNKRNTSFLGGEPMGDEFLEKMKRLLFKHT